MRVQGRAPALPVFLHQSTRIQRWRWLVAGHSQFKNIMHRKGAQDAKRARAFAKLIREITVSARQGLPDPAFNPRLRSAMVEARSVNMPRDTIERAVKKAAGASAGED